MEFLFFFFFFIFIIIIISYPPSCSILQRLKIHQNGTPMSSISATFSLAFRSSSLSLSSFSPANKSLFFNSNNVAKPPRYRPRRCSVLNLITDPDSFQVGKLIGSYGFINVTRFFLFFLRISFVAIYLCSRYPRLNSGERNYSSNLFVCAVIRGCNWEWTCKFRLKTSGD